MLVAGFGCWRREAGAGAARGATGEGGTAASRRKGEPPSRQSPSGIWCSAYSVRRKIPDGALVCGREENGDPLFVARANLNGGLHPGKIRFAFGAAFIGFGGKEVPVNNYEVLTSPVVVGREPE